MKKPQDIIILQIATAGIAAIRVVLSPQGITRDVDYIGINNPYQIEKLIYDNQPQLLITGIVSDRVRDVEEMVESLRKKNQQLVVVCYSSIQELPGDFDEVIDKRSTDSCLDLASVITRFQSGSLRQKVE